MKLIKKIKMSSSLVFKKINSLESPLKIKTMDFRVFLTNDVTSTGDVPNIVGTKMVNLTKNCQWMNIWLKYEIINGTS